MIYDSDQHDRKTARLREWDYSRDGWYFVTICTHDREFLFGDVVDGKMELNAFGRIAREEWLRTERLRLNVKLDAFVVMPNHVHGIIGIVSDDRMRIGNCDKMIHGSRDTMHRVPTHPGITSTHPVEREFGKPVAGSLSTIVGCYKAAVTRRLNRIWSSSGSTVWQSRYHDRIIRNRAEHEALRWYIRHNPANWQDDYLYT